MEDSIITEQMRHLIGVEAPPYFVDVEKGDLRRFLAATGDTNPLFCNEERAKANNREGVVFPPTFFCPDPIIAASIAGLERPFPFKYRIDGGTEWEFHGLVRVGDVLSITIKIADLYEKQGGPQTGRMLFTIIEAICHNQREELVGIARSTHIVYEGPNYRTQEVAKP